MILVVRSHWRKYGMADEFRGLMRRTCRGNSIELSKRKLRSLLGISFKPEGIPLYRERKSKKKTRGHKIGYRTSGGGWYSIVARTSLAGCVMTDYRIWRLCAAALYVANDPNPNGTRMSKLADFNRSNSYKLLEKLVARKIALRSSLDFNVDNKLERGIVLAREMFRKTSAAPLTGRGG